MVSLQLYSRGEAKQYLELLFDQISKKQYSDARDTAMSLKTCLLKYYLTRDIDCDNINDVFHEFDFLLRNARGSTKQDTLFKLIKKIRSTSQLSVANPIDRLRQIYDDMRYAYLHLTKENTETILDCFDEMRDLKPKMQEIGGSVYNYFTLAQKAMGECEAILVDVTTFQKKNLDRTTIKGVTASFQKLFSNIQSVFAPPILIAITREDIQRELSANKSLEEISKATGHRQEELQAMLSSIEREGTDED